MLSGVFHSTGSVRSPKFAHATTLVFVSSTGTHQRKKVLRPK